jgi:hypothetical protein
MKLEQLQQKLLAAARAHPPDDGVPYAFEKSILARLRESPTFDVSALWARALWRGAATCVALTFLLGVWSFIGAGNSAITDTEELSQHFEQTMLAAVDDPEEVW